MLWEICKKNMDNINLIIWDLDGTKYKFHDDIHNIANHLLVDIVNERLVAQGLALLPDDEIVSLGEKSYDKSGISWKIFTQIYNIDPHDLFQAFNMKMPLFTVDSIASAAYKEKINLTKARGVDHIIFTHGSRAWAKKVLDKLGLAQEFNDNKIWGCPR
jgi:FMN phosphatase YigB (HAD superfamily)